MTRYDSVLVVSWGPLMCYEVFILWRSSMLATCSNSTAVLAGVWYVFSHRISLKFSPCTHEKHIYGQLSRTNLSSSWHGFELFSSKSFPIVQISRTYKSAGPLLYRFIIDEDPTYAYYHNEAQTSLKLFKNPWLDLNEKFLVVMSCHW